MGGIGEHQRSHDEPAVVGRDFDRGLIDEDMKLDQLARSAVCRQGRGYELWKLRIERDIAGLSPIEKEVGGRRIVPNDELLAGAAEPCRIARRDPQRRQRRRLSLQRACGTRLAHSSGDAKEPGSIGASLDLVRLERDGDRGIAGVCRSGGLGGGVGVAAVGGEAACRKGINPGGVCAYSLDSRGNELLGDLGYGCTNAGTIRGARLRSKLGGDKAVRVGHRIWMSHHKRPQQQHAMHYPLRVRFDADFAQFLLASCERWLE